MVTIVSMLAVMALCAGFMLLSYVARRRGFELKKIGKPLALVLVLVSFARYIYDQAAVYDLVGLSDPNSPFSSAFLTFVGVMLIWLSYAAMLTIVLGEFFEFKTLKQLINCFSIPTYLLIFAIFGVYGIAAFGEELYAFSTVRLWLLILEVALAISIPAIRYIGGEKIELPHSKAEGVRLLYTAPLAMLAIMPCYVPQALFEKLDETLMLFDFTEEHRFMLYFSIIIPYLIYLGVKDKTPEAKRFLMIYLSVGLMWVYLGRWNLEMLENPLSWPLHLCNTAMFLVPLCLIFEMEKLFNFCLYINVMGAFLAMIMPTDLSGANALATERVSFWVNHYAAFFMPVLLVALKIFKRPKFRQWVYAVIALTVYFIAMLIVNAWFSNYGECDYFFLNSDFIVSKLGKWAEDTRNFVVQFTTPGGLKFVFYPVYQALFYLVYIGFTVGIWFLYAVLFTSWDAAEDRRNREKDYKRMKKELKEYLGGRSIHEPVGGDASPRLTLSHFSKRYGSNKHYSVNDVSFDVRGGEIFGFLGPNGAGKSTIIKSVVGIQTITSGNIEICGFDVERQPVQAKLHTGFVPDHYALYENLTGREYINYIADLFQVGYDYRNEVIEKYVERFQLTGSFDNQMKTYSHGMKQKITIMAALVHNPKVWILDEPLTGLDPTSIYEVKECMKEHAAKGNIVFFSSHIIDVVEKICDRIAIIKKGKLRACTTIRELEEKGIELEEFYLSIINDGDDSHVPYTENESVGGAASV